MKNTIPVTIHLEKNNRKRLEHLADSRKRTLSAEVNILIENAYQYKEDRDQIFRKKLQVDEYKG